MVTHWLIFIAAAYLAGSISFALLIGKMRGVDIRKHGSGNVGATNAGRVLGRKWGILCFVLDVAKGALPVAIAGVVMDVTSRADLGAEAWWWLGVAVAAVVGHMFPVWLKFKGGKGVATGLGVLLGFWPLLTLAAVVAAVVWIAMMLAFRIVSLASMIASMTLPPAVAIIGRMRGSEWADLLPFLIVTATLAGLVVIRHRSNVKRLLAGEEPTVGQAKAHDHMPPAGDSTPSTPSNTAHELDAIEADDATASGSQRTQA